MSELRYIPADVVLQRVSNRDDLFRRQAQHTGGGFIYNGRRLAHQYHGAAALGAVCPGQGAGHHDQPRAVHRHLHNANGSMSPFTEV